MVRRWIVGSMWIASACGPVISASDEGTSGEDTTGTSGMTTSNPGTFPQTGPPDPSNPSEPGTDPSAPTSMSTSGNPTEPSTDPTIDPVDTSDSDTCGLFICNPDGSNDGGECDLWSQDCPEDEKCMPWANDGGVHWNAARCSPNFNEAQIGDPCVVEGSYVSGIDNCALGSMCLFVDPMTNEGECVANCSGSEANPVCQDPATTCSIDFEGTMINCLAPCNPLLQDCADGGCYPTDFSFVCAPTIGVDGIPGNACEHDWDCVPGSVCLDAEYVPACEDEMCCAPICDITMPEQCEDTECAYWFEQGQAPPGLEQVGVCLVGG